MFIANVRLRVKEAGILSFMTHQRGKLMEKNPGLSTTLATKILLENWRLLPRKERQSWNPTQSDASPSAANQGRKPKPTGLIAFITEESRTLASQNTGLSELEITERISEKWRSLTKEARAKWSEIDAQLQNRKCVSLQSSVVSPSTGCEGSLSERKPTSSYSNAHGDSLNACGTSSLKPGKLNLEKNNSPSLNESQASNVHCVNTFDGYIPFYSSILPKILGSGCASVSQSSREIRDRWGNLSSDEKKQWASEVLPDAHHTTRRQKKCLNGFSAFMRAQGSHLGQRGRSTHSMAKAWRALSAEDREKFKAARVPLPTPVARPVIAVKSTRQIRRELFYLDDYLEVLWKGMRSVGDTPSDQHMFELFVRQKIRDRNYHAADFRLHCAKIAQEYQKGFRSVLVKILDRLQKSIPRIKARRGEVIITDNTKNTVKNFHIAEVYCHFRRNGLKHDRLDRFRAAVRKYERITPTVLKKFINLQKFAGKQFKKVSFQQGTR